MYLLSFQPQDKSLSLSSSFQGSTLDSTPSSSQSSLPGGSTTGKYRFSPQMESTPQMNGHSEGREGDKEISDIVGADNTLPPYSASTRGKGFSLQILFLKLDSCLMVARNYTSLGGVDTQVNRCPKISTVINLKLFDIVVGP